MRLVALKGGLDFFPLERVLPVASPDFFDMETIKSQTDSRTPVLA
jgi:hypothetical protein